MSLLRNLGSVTPHTSLRQLSPTCYNFGDTSMAGKKMNKTEAAEFLGIGVRTLERYMTQNRVAYTRQRGKTGDSVIFERSELEHLKRELYQPTYEGAVEVRQGSPSNSSEMVTTSQMRVFD